MQRAIPSNLSGATRAFWVFGALTAAVGTAFVVRAAFDARASLLPQLCVALLLAAVSLGLALAALLVHRSPLPALARHFVALVLAYHALFGPVLLVSRAVRPTSRNDDLVAQVWPHVIGAINALE